VAQSLEAKLTHYTVILTRFQPPPDGQRGLTETERLAKAFGISLERADVYVQSMPCVVKQSATAAEAERYRQLLGRIGAVVELKPHAGAAPASTTAVTPARPPSLMAPPMASTPPSAAPSAAPMDFDGVSFFGGMHRALLAPLKGGGIAWLLALSGTMFVVAAATAIPCLGLFIALPFLALYCGLYREMFGHGVSRGASDDPNALELSDLTGFQARALEIAINGLVLMVVAGVLLSATSYAWSAAGLSEESVQVCANPNMAQDAYRQTETGEETEPSDEVENDDATASDPKASTNSPRRGCMNAPALRLRGFVLAWLMLFVQGIYWAMALTLSCLTMSIAGLFRVVRIARAIYTGGWAYLTIVALGATGFSCIILIPTLIVAWGSPLGAIALLLLTLPWIAYVGAAVSYLMGRLLWARAEELAFLDELPD